MVTPGAWIPAIVLALIAGWTDWRTRRIPNWLTVSGAIAGIAVNCLLQGWTGAKSAALGMLLGLGLLLPFVLIRSLGAGDMSDHTDKEFHHLLDGAQKMKWTPGEKILLFAILLMY